MKTEDIGEVAQVYGQKKFTPGIQDIKQERKCPYGYQGKMICGNLECTKSGLLCVEDQCRCCIQHKQCCLFNFNQFVERIKSKQLTTQPLLEHVNNIFNKIIDEISNLQQQTLRIINSFGLDQTQKQLLEMIENKSYGQITGELIAQISQNLNQKKDKKFIQNVKDRLDLIMVAYKTQKVQQLLVINNLIKQLGRRHKREDSYYSNQEKIIKINQILPGDNNLYFYAKILQVEMLVGRRGRMMRCILGDETGIVTAVFPYHRIIQAQKTFFFYNFYAQVENQHIQIRKSRNSIVRNSERKIVSINQDVNISTKSWVAVQVGDTEL